MGTQVITLVPSKKKKILVTTSRGAREFSHPGEVVKGFELLKGRGEQIREWLDSYEEKKRKAIERRLLIFRELEEKEAVVCGIMGGWGQSLFVRAADLGIPVQRIPFYRLAAQTNIAPKSLPGERAEATKKAWEAHPDMFYPLAPVAPSIALARELTRERLGIQDLRKPMQLRFYHALREVRLILPPETEEAINLIEEAAKNLFQKRSLKIQIEQALLRLEALLPSEEGKRILAVTRHYAHPRFIIAAKEDEEELEEQIEKLMSGLPIWQLLHENGSSLLPPLKGLGPALGGAIIAETGDIRRFPSPKAYRAYARFHVNGDGAFPRRKAGLESSWNPHLNRAVWLWSTDQVLRYKHPWASLVLWKKAQECRAHPDVVERQVMDRKGRARQVWDYTLKHLDARARRWGGSQLLNYLWEIWTALEEGKDVESWYRQSSWPSYFERVEAELQQGLGSFLAEEIKRRRRREPEEEAEEEELE